MKTIGLLGGMHWERTAAYYHGINAVVREQLGGVHSAPCLICSVDYHPIRQSLLAGQWAEVGQALGEAARSLERGGADFLVICTNIMHKVAAPVRRVSRYVRVTRWRTSKYEKDRPVRNATSPKGGRKS
ncbi:aspartate/glutamate racemase family protein [uncultured Desulfovibrio sp.]|uniref:aspartate/glutamate racemase family protein n=1 Tax=uncultured Desulfovibrio sp. TaxID=167968 RepID=UPI00261A8EEC|nr:aspartate/glutamate racemase family protein [uncultured Desulfovibrio sp.]